MRNIEDIQENFKRGVIDLIILGLLEQEDMYPYQIHQEIERRSGDRLKFFVGSMYGPLRRMLENGEISERKVPVGPRRVRNYYHLEEAGVQYLNLLRREYFEMTEGMALIFQQKEDAHE